MAGRATVVNREPLGHTMTAVSTDFELLEAWRGGDKAAGNRLFDRYFENVYRFFRNKVTDGAEDLVQQTFLALVQSRDHFRGDSSFRTYLFTAARSKLYTYLERRRREGERIDHGVTSCEDLGISPSRVLAKEENERLLLHALRRLPIDMQIALELFYFEQMRGPELAAALGVAEGTVRSRIRRGRELLRERLDALMQSPDRVQTTMTNLEQWARALREEVLEPE
jgi:RNA polymerase sigma factor (sigma-70 family)